MADDDAAIAAHERAGVLQPDNADYHFNRALCLLRAGRFSSGFDTLEWRWRSAAQTTAWRDPGVPLWDGRPLDGQTVLIWAEQGLGDSIQFSRYLQFIRDRGGRAVLEVQPELKALLAHCPLADAVSARDQDPTPPADFHVPMMSLPRLAGTTVDTCPPPTPLAPLPRRHRPDGWDRNLNIGLIWAGNPKHKRDAERSLPLAVLAPIGGVAGTALHVLQHGAARDQVQACGFAAQLTVHPETTDLLDAAGLIGMMDLIITVDTAHAHLAGTLGVETWVLLRYLPDWRWLRRREDSIWYPSVRLFRQKQDLDWQTVVAEIADHLSRRQGAAAPDQDIENTAPNRAIAGATPTPCT
jgi:hypothetical protein